MKKTFLILSSMCLLLSSGIHAQVTIGSAQKPAIGALLDLKQEGTTTKGLGMPRVQLQDIDKLKMSATGTEHADKVAHTGLIVYNVSGEAVPKCAPIPDGLYVWDGAKWQGLGITKVDHASLDVGVETTFDLLSGKDARGAITAQSFTAIWQSGDGTVAYGNTAHATLGGVAFSGVNALPASGSLTPSPRVFPLLPDAMTIVPTTPWQSKETTLSFDAVDECGGSLSKTITLNQTNYALKVNNQFGNSQIIYTTAANGNFDVEGNATWTTSKNDVDNILTATTPVIGVADGSNIKDYPTTALHTTNFSTTVGGERYQTADITFTDTESIKRFDDITVSILNCTDNDPALNAWALRAGFTQAQINSVAVGGTHATTQPNGIQLHKDQSGNIFLSGLFGTERWMLNNLSATAYAPGNPHSQGRALYSRFDAAWDKACYGYPNLRGMVWNANYPTLYNNNPRLGLLYSWDAATGGKGGGNGQAVINDGEQAATPNIDPQTTRVQGICPNSWHLPSDWEWTQLENELNTNTSRYSGIANANGTINIGIVAYRGTTHGEGMKDPCPTPGQTAYPSSGGASNVISATVAPGFNALLAGGVNLTQSGFADNYGTVGYMMSASGSGTYSMWSRNFGSGDSQAERSHHGREDMFSVRCKKN